MTQRLLEICKYFLIGSLGYFCKFKVTTCIRKWCIHYFSIEKKRYLSYHIFWAIELFVNLLTIPLVLIFKQIKKKWEKNTKFDRSWFFVIYRFTGSSSLKFKIYVALWKLKNIMVNMLVFFVLLCELEYPHSVKSTWPWENVITVNVLHLAVYSI